MLPKPFVKVIISDTRKTINRNKWNIENQPEDELLLLNQEEIFEIQPQSAEHFLKMGPTGRNIWHQDREEVS